MNLWVECLIIVAAAAAAVTLMFLARRRTSAGGLFTDTDRAAGVFGVLGTSFAVVLAFVIFLAFESYGSAKDKAGVEAISVSELFRESALFSPQVHDALQGELICYARSVIDDEWPAMRRQRTSPLVDRWLANLDSTVARAPITGDKQAAEFSHWLDSAAARQDGRRGRLAEAPPFVPPPLWFLLLFGAILVIGYTVFFADSGERFLVQAMMIGTLTAIVVSSLLTIRFLDRPYENRSGSIKPVEMTRTLRLMEGAARLPGPARCDLGGRPSPP